jgi:hypothetical protein
VSSGFLAGVAALVKPASMQADRNKVFAMDGILLVADRSSLIMKLNGRCVDR